MTSDEALPELAGWTVGVTAERRREELGGALERRGARVVYGPAIRVVPLADDSRLREATGRCLETPLDVVVATTAVGFRGWLEAAASWQRDTALMVALGEADVLTRGPKVRGAVRAAGLREAWSPESESSAEVLAHLLARDDLAGRRIAIQLHGDPLHEMVDALRERGAEVIEVPVYRWEAPADPAPLHDLIAAVADSTIDAVTFTSAPAATNFVHTADALGLDVHTALRSAVLCVAVGPVTAAPLVAAGVPVVQPERFRLGALVREVSDRLPRQASRVRAAGHEVELRGHAVVVDGMLVEVSRAAVALLRELGAGSVVPRSAATEPAVAELRDAVDADLVFDDAHGYRLNV